MSAIRPILVALLAVGAASAMTLSSAVIAADGAAPAISTSEAKDPKAPVAKVPAAKGSTAKTLATEGEPQVPKLTAAEILERHVAARGGSQAWKSVQSIQFTGKIEAGRGDNIARARKLSYSSKKTSRRGTNLEVAAANADTESSKQIELPFTLDLKRPNRTRLEIAFDGKTALQVFDGEHGWKYRPFLNRKDVEPFTADEATAEASHADLDGPLIDAVAKGTQVELEGADLVDAQPAYRLKVTPKNGSVKHVWIDAKTFLDVKVEGPQKRMDGKMHPVYVYQRDFRSVQGVTIPFQQETAVDGYTDTHKLQVEKVEINPALDDAVFSKPQV